MCCLDIKECMCCLRSKLENVERLLGKHSLAEASDLDSRLAAWHKKQV